LTEINLGTEEDLWPTFISASLPEEVANKLKTFLRGYMDCFAWSYKEMPGLDPKVAVHYLKIDPTFRPIKQAPRRMRVELEEKVVEETKKLINAGFIREEEMPEWVASIVPVKKKNGQIRICVDFQDLNKACPKDDFPLPVTEIIIDHTSSYEVFSFMDGYAGYNQIKMAVEDENHTAFRMPIGIYCYKVMPFGLKNAGATYQRAMMKIFDDMIHKIVECYVDDLVIKAMSYEEHLQHLEVVFSRLREHALKLNPLKCAFMVSSGKFLGFVVRHRGIEIDLGKIKVIIELPPPKNLKQLRSLQGQLAYIRRFIANLSGKFQPFTRLTKKDIPFEWDGKCQQAFEEIKVYLLNPPVLAAPILGKELILYTTVLDGSLGALLAQENHDGNQNALYYLSRMMVGSEHRYSPIEKYCLAIIFAVKKLRHYMLAHKIILISKVDPLKYLMTRPMLTGRLAKWAIILAEFDITYTP
jgi:RNase H-like domain found in reverse transcriptase/Reverse transcriptase (RNA-dependent DNA polymerase)